MARKTPSKTRGVFERERGSGIWWIRYQVGGKPKREKVGRRSDALALYQQRKSEVRAGAKLPQNMRLRRVSVEDIGRRAIEWYTQHNRKDLRNFTSRMNSIIEGLGVIDAEVLKPSEIDKWLSSHSRWSPATANRHKTVLSKAYQLAVRNGDVSANPARLVDHRPEKNKRIRYLLSEEEDRLREVMAHTAPTQIAALHIALNTGMRKGEQFSLEWPQIDFGRKRIYLSETKNGSDREIPLNKSCIAVLTELYERRPDNGAIFRSSRYDRPLLDPKKWFETALRNADIHNFTWHDLRHTFISRLVMLGADLRAVQELAGHKSITMTVRYSHLSPQHNQKTIELLDGTSSRDFNW
jgi:site-specific recombinase XerD